MTSRDAAPGALPSAAAKTGENFRRCENSTTDPQSDASATPFYRILAASREYVIDATRTNISRQDLMR